MTIKHLSAFLLLLLLTACSQTNKKGIKTSSIIELNNRITPLVASIDNSDSCLKALSLLDSATSIDRNCFLCFQNKLMFLTSLKRYKQAILVNDTLINFAPNAQDLYLTGGILREYNQDTISSIKFFQKSLAIINFILDTMKETNRDYAMLLTNKAFNLKMIDKDTDANKILQSLYDGMPYDPAIDNIERNEILKTMKNTKWDLRRKWAEQRAVH